MPLERSIYFINDFLAFDITILSISLELYWKNELCENVLSLGNLVMAFRVRFISALDLFCNIYIYIYIYLIFFWCLNFINWRSVGWLVG